MRESMKLSAYLAGCVTLTVGCTTGPLHEGTVGETASAHYRHASPLRRVSLSVGMKREEAEELIAEATGIPETYNIFTMHGEREASYRHGTTTLVVRYRPGLPAPWGDGHHWPPIDATVLSWEFGAKSGANRE